MRKSEFRGWTEVFRFTFIQTWKNRSFLIFMIISWVVCMLAVPVLSAISSSKKDTGEYHIEKVNADKVYVYDEIGLTLMGFDTTAFKKAEVFKDLPVVPVNVNPLSETREQEWKDFTKKVDEEPKSIVIHIRLDATHSFSFDVVRAIESDVTKKECEYIGSLLVEEFNEFKYKATNFGEEQQKALDTTYEVTGLLEEKDGTFVTEKAHISTAKYWVVYGVLFVVMMVCITGAMQIATAVAMDKSSKVMEYMLTSIRPMALIFGKVLAQVVSVIIQMGVSFGLALLSNFVTGQVTGNNYLQTKLPAGIFSSLNPLNIALALVVIALGVMLYGFIAGLCGAMVTKMEELQESVSLLTMTNIIGSYLALFAAMAMQKSLTSPLFYAAVLIPISSPFLLPGVVLIGEGAWWIKLLSLAILFVMDVIILFTSARVYEALLLYNGNKIKLKDLKKFLKEAKGGKAA
ncbi:MAG: ABC transporter permease [Lachnospiraceae bacterium]|nr:ABC transporter permease [Lachnospiraceae bacterium]